MIDFSTFLLPLLASAFGGGIVAGAFSVYNRVATSSEEHAKWLRNEKVKAYGAFLKSAEMLVVVCTSVWAGRGKTEDAVSALRESQLGELELLAPPALRKSAMELDEASGKVYVAMVSRDEKAYDHAIEDFDKLKQEYVSMAQQDLGIAKPSDLVSGSELATSDNDR